MKYVVLTLGSVGLLAVVGIWLDWHFLSPKDMDTEIAKSLLSILTASVVTQAIAVVIYQYNESRKAQLERDAFRAHVLDRVNDAFVKVKGVRRRVRAQSELDNGKITLTRDNYQNAMEELNDTQLGLEVVAKDVETNSKIFEDGQIIFRGIRAMEEYLNQLINEWEHDHAAFSGEPPQAVSSLMPRFNDLLSDYKNSQFRPQFVHSYYQTIEKIRASMTDGKTLRWQILLKPLGEN
jgi:hypothetical protein